MKKLGKITTSPEKIMKNEELINLQGGYDNPWCCYCIGHGYIYGVSTHGQCYIDCWHAFEAYPHWGYGYHYGEGC